MRVIRLFWMSVASFLTVGTLIAVAPVSISSHGLSSISISLSTPRAFAFGNPPACGPETNGQWWVDPCTGIVWECGWGYQGWDWYQA